jgi:hypothetical protein
VEWEYWDGALNPIAVAMKFPEATISGERPDRKQCIVTDNIEITSSADLDFLQIPACPDTRIVNSSMRNVLVWEAFLQRWLPDRQSASDTTSAST